MTSEIDFINSVFTQDSFVVTTDGERILIDSKKDGKKCLVLKIIENTIEIVRLEKCNTTGNLLLSLVEKLARIIPNIHHISLLDGSRINTNCRDRNGHYISIDLATLKILTKGVSWYNSHGYISPNSKEEERRNSEILQKSFEEVIQLCTKKQIDDFTSNNSVEKLEKRLERMISEGADPETNLDIMDLRNNIKKYPFYLSLNIRKFERQQKMLIDEARSLFPHINPTINIKAYVNQMLESIDIRSDVDLSCSQYEFISNLFQVISSVLYYDRIVLTKEIHKPTVGGKSKKQRKTKTKKQRKTKTKKL